MSVSLTQKVKYYVWSSLSCFALLPLNCLMAIEYGANMDNYTNTCGFGLRIANYIL